jgi:uncharacterized protein (TIGR02996 family)
MPRSMIALTALGGLICMVLASCPFSMQVLLSDPGARLVYADWLEEHNEPKEAALWRRLGGLRLSEWTCANLNNNLHSANAGLAQGSVYERRKDRRLTLEDCLMAALKAATETAPFGCFCVHSGAVAFGWRKGYTTVCLAVRKADGTVAVDVACVRATTSGGSPARAWRELVQFRPDTRPCQERLKAWAEKR